MFRESYGVRFKMNLQIFAEGEGGGPEGSGGGAENLADFVTPNWGMPQGYQSPAEPEPNETQEDILPPGVEEPVADPAPVVEPFDFAGRKIEVSDPAMLAILNDIKKDYTSLQSTYTQSSQQLKSLEAERNALMNVIQTGQQSTNQPQVPVQPTAEDLERQKSEFMDLFYEDPQKALGSLIESTLQKTIKPVIDPIVQEREMNQQLKSLHDKYGAEEFSRMVEPMQQVLAEMPHLAEHGVDTVYQVALGRVAQQQQQQPPAADPTPAPTPEQLMNDPDFLQNYVYSNPIVQKQVVTQYLQQKQNTNGQVPPSIGGQPGGQPPAIPEQRPKTLREASQAFMSTWRN